MRGYRTVKLEREIKNNSVFLRTVDPLKFRYLRDFVDGSIIDLSKIIRRLKTTTANQTSAAAIQSIISTSPNLRQHSIFSLNKEGDLNRAKSVTIRHAAIACGLHQESSGALPSWLSSDYKWTLIVENNVRLTNCIMPRLGQAKLISTIEELLAEQLSIPVDVAFFSFPCINRTVLRTNVANNYADTKSGKHFKESHLKVAHALKYPDVIASELVSPYSEDYSNHLFVENQMTDSREMPLYHIANRDTILL